MLLWHFLHLKVYVITDDSISYGYSCDMGRLLIGYSQPMYGVKIKQNDIIGIHIDFKNYELSFSINNKNYGKAYDIDKCNYKIVVSMYDENANLQLII